MARLTLSSSTSGWKLVPAGGAAAGRRRRAGAAGAADPFANQLTTTGRVTIVSENDAEPDSRRGAVPSPVLELTVEASGAGPHVLMARHPSGAISFHFPVPPESGGAGRRSAVLRFRVAAASTASDRRGLIGAAIRLVLLKVASVVARKALPILAAAAERAAWKLRKLAPGWVSVPSDGSWPEAFSPISPNTVFAPPPGRNLLLVHGLFSNAEGAFRGLASTAGSGGRTLFEELGAVYEGRVFAFNHFTVSQSPEENARALLERLPAGPTTFDVITHSRGGVVFRHLIERPDLLGSLAKRFQLGRAILVASPNDGSPLASRDRLDVLLGWVANLLDLFPDNPFTTGLQIVSEGLSWLAGGITGQLPGIAALDPKGPVIERIQAPPNPPAGALSALVANYEPDESLLRRMGDAAVDAYFASANDLVVPSEGGWRLGPALAMPGAQIGCFGPGGNLRGAAADGVHHFNFFAQPTTVDFLVRALRGNAQELPPIDPGRALPYLSSRRGGPSAEPGAGAVAGKAASAPVTPPAPTPGEGTAPPLKPAAALPRDAETFELIVLRGSDREDLELLAKFRNATRLEKIPREDGPSSGPLARIRRTQDEIRAFIDGQPDAPDLPEGQALVELGTGVFESLFPGEVRRLYDVARASQPQGRLNVVFTSMDPAVSDLPWEFAYDGSRRSFIAAEEVNFVRNVDTAIPADRIPPRAGPLRILVVVAQPIGTGHLSYEEEIEVIRGGFWRLLESGLAEVHTLAHATPDSLHRSLEASAEPYDVLHFIGHGSFEAGKKGEPGTGYLCFEDADGRTDYIDAPTFRQLVSRRGIRLVFLNACETGRGGLVDFDRGVAPDLVAAGVPTVVANQFSVLDTAATAFARHFYWCLGIGMSVGDAAREARVAVNVSISGEALDWAVPVVFTQDACARLVERQPSVVSQLSPVDAPSVRRASRRRTERVAFWDVQRILPTLDQIAATLTAAQEFFSFEAVSFSAPLGTWRRDKREGTEMAYLWAEKVAERLKEKPSELGVDRLMCITNLFLRDDETLGLFVWDEAKDERISLFSTAGLLEQLEPPGLSLERMVANAAAGILTRLSAHKRGPKDCPLYYNEELDMRFIAGPLRLCAPDLAKLKKQPDRLKAVQRLLEIYGSTGPVTSR